MEFFVSSETPHLARRLPRRCGDRYCQNPNISKANTPVMEKKQLQEIYTPVASSSNNAKHQDPPSKKLLIHNTRLCRDQCTN